MDISFAIIFPGHVFLIVWFAIYVWAVFWFYVIVLLSSPTLSIFKFSMFVSLNIE